MLTPWVSSTVAIDATAVPLPVLLVEAVEDQVKLPAPFEIPVASTVNTTPSWVPVYAPEVASTRGDPVFVQAPV